ncbi:N-acetyltransferase family protein [Janibacter sp. G56]|uniref:GNAT family N-acetyltransferase n=1 Tax=Janibacter sp. G56 TaxID=3418717 RepID=UPI003D0927DD
MSLGGRGAAAGVDAAGHDVVIREATGNDLADVVHVGHVTWPATYREAFGDEFIELGLAKWWTPEATIPAIRAGRCLVAEVDGEVVGMASYGPLEGHAVLWKIYVLPAHHSRGIGQLLMDEVVARVTGEWDELRLSHYAGNDRARSFYERNGFVEFEREEMGAGMPVSVWMRRPL